MVIRETWWAKRSFVYSVWDNMFTVALFMSWNMNCLSFLFATYNPLLCQVWDRGGERCCGSPAVLRRPALIWWSSSPVRILPATCGRSNKKKDAFPLKAPVVLELQSRMWPVSPLKVMSSICPHTKGAVAPKWKSSLIPWSFFHSQNAEWVQLSNPSARAPGRFTRGIHFGHKGDGIPPHPPW